MTDTVAINRAVEACAHAGGGQVHFPPGHYLSGTVHLRSRVTLNLDAGAVLIGTTNLSQYQRPAVPDHLWEAQLGQWHRALIVGENLEDVAITGQGVIDGRHVFDPEGEEKMRGPHAIAFINCQRFSLRDISIRNAANYAIFFMLSHEVDIRNVKITGGWDGIHFRGSPDLWCRDVTITDCQFSTGDDAIAGYYWDNTVITRCVINSSCNGIRVIGPVTRLIVNDCLFHGPGRHPHRTSLEKRRTNMLSGINIQPGAWNPTHGLLDDVLLSNNTMHHVAAPVTIWIGPGNTAGRITVAGLAANGVYQSAITVQNWAHAPISSIVLRDLSVEFSGGVSVMPEKSRDQTPDNSLNHLPAWGLYITNVGTLLVEDARFSLEEADLRPVIQAERVGKITLDNVKYPHGRRVSHVYSSARQDNAIFTVGGESNSKEAWEADYFHP